MKRTKVSLSNTKLLSANMGKLIPVGCYEVLPGDTFRMRTDMLIRMAPLATPVMHPVQVKTYQFFVPSRLLWDNFEKFITGGEHGDDTNTIPKVSLTESDRDVGSLADYLGIPPGPTSYNFNAMPFQAYNLIWNKWFRDQDLQDERLNPKTNGDFNSSTLDITLASVNWNKDRFTTARVLAQKGAPVIVPVTGNATLATGSTVDVNLKSATGVHGKVLTAAAHAAYGSATPLQGSNAAGNSAFESTGGVDSVYDPNGTLEANLDGAPVDVEDIGTLIEDIRYGAALQRFRERMQRAGARYVEYLRSSFGVKSSDARLQNPELLATGSGQIQFSEVLQTTPNSQDGTTDPDGVGNMTGHGIAYNKSNRFIRFFEEHGFIMTLIVVKPIAMYTQGIEKMWIKTNREDFYDKDLALLGEQEVLNYEVYGNQTAPSDPFGRFGYQRRYYDYMTKLSSVAGEFRTTLNDWHMARIFDENVALNSAFVTCNPTNRIYQATTASQMYIRADNSVQVRRAIIPSRPGIL